MMVILMVIVKVIRLIIVTSIYDDHFHLSLNPHYIKSKLHILDLKVKKSTYLSIFSVSICI